MTDNDTPAPQQEPNKVADFKALERHASALGWVVISWCRLYDELALLFVELLNPDNKKPLLAAWHSVKSDRTQRFMLRAVAENSLCGKWAPLRRRILWTIGQMDHMENRRNDAVHAPVTIGLDDDFSKIVVFPQTQADNPRAKTLLAVEADLESEFRTYQRNADALAGYVRLLRPFLKPGAPPLDQLPRRPQLEGILRATARKQESSNPPPQGPPQTSPA